MRITGSAILLLSLLAAPGIAYPGTGITAYYERALPLADQLLPDGLRVAKWSSPGAGTPAPLIDSPCLRYGPGEFSRLFFLSPSARRMKEVFVESGVDVDRLTAFLRAHSLRGPETVALFDEGYLLLTDPAEKANYIVPIGKGTVRKLLPLSE